MDEEEWEDDEVREFTRLVEQYECYWKPIINELKLVNVGTKKELKIEMLILVGDKCSLISLLKEYAHVFA